MEGSGAGGERTEEEGNAKRQAASLRTDQSQSWAEWLSTWIARGLPFRVRCLLHIVHRAVTKRTTPGGRLPPGVALFQRETRGSLVAPLAEASGVLGHLAVIDLKGGELALGLALLNGGLDGLGNVAQRRLLRFL